MEASAVERDMSKEIGRKIMVYRTGIGMPQWELAEKVGLTQPHLSFIEKGQRTLSVDALARIATAMNCRIVDLLPVSQGGKPII